MCLAQLLTHKDVDGTPRETVRHHKMPQGGNREERWAGIQRPGVRSAPAQIDLRRLERRAGLSRAWGFEERAGTVRDWVLREERADMQRHLGVRSAPVA